MGSASLSANFFGFFVLIKRYNLQQQQQQQQHSICPKLTGVGYMDQIFSLCSIKCN
ncbi:hypothetical protein Syun_029127 [Stephania yunnanensis]|uniref:Uncharacterized protein n=1 Tax=Stephania yunnanensis TaxID=152371 RepID=A0AAP0E815_9MAGN